MGMKTRPTTGPITGLDTRASLHMPHPRPPLRWSEIAVMSNASFLRGASHPEELVTRAWELGYSGIALVDQETFGGSVRAHVAAKELVAGRGAILKPRSEAGDRVSEFRLACGDATSRTSPLSHGSSFLGGALPVAHQDEKPCGDA